MPSPTLVPQRGSKCSALVGAVLLLAAPATAGLTEAPRLAAVYDAILAARFDRAETALRQACPPAPTEACAVFEAVSLWWQILQEPDDHTLDSRFNERAAAAIRAGEAWTKREPQRAEAWFYFAGAHAPLVQWRVLRGERLAAARDGKRIKDALERTLQLDPSLADAHFGIGLYEYYADVAPTVAKILRWLLLLPGGDRAKGLDEMTRAREHGALLKGEADYQLYQIYLWYEHNPARAIELLDDLDAKYPTNPLFLQRLAELQDQWVHDRPASAAAWQTLVERARQGRVYQPARAEARARLGLAGQLDDMYETDRAIDHLKVVVGSDSAQQRPALIGRAYLQLGLAYDRVSDRDHATAAYRAALEHSSDGATDVLSRAREALRRTPDREKTEAYRLSLEGWRAFERGSLREAAASLRQATDRDAADPVTRYRYARVLAANGDAAGARQQLESLLSARTAPAFVLASAYVAYANVLERAGDRARAIENYRSALQVRGGEPKAFEQARAALKRLGAS